MTVFSWRSLVTVVAILVSGCHLLVPPPSSVKTSVALDERNLPIFSYWPSIKAERELRKKEYFLAGVQVREVDCPGPRCDRLVWDLKNDAVWGRTLPSPQLVRLPERITYGETIPGMETVIPPANLTPNVRYSVVIGIMGLDQKYEDRIHFSADTVFSLRGADGAKPQ